MQQSDVIILGAGASGLMCALAAGQRKRRVMVLDHGRAGRKILVSGGGRCNFANRNLTSEHYLSHNPHFCKSALQRFNQTDFLQLVEKHGIEFEERDHGQLFCRQSASEILAMLLKECQEAGVVLQLDTKVLEVSKPREGVFVVATNRGDFHGQALVVATGGLSLPTLGATPLGYKIAAQFGLKIWPTSAGLVPLTLQPADKERLALLAGIALEAVVTCGRRSFRENLLFTHRGLSGPVILQISSYWRPGEELALDLLPGLDLAAELKSAQRQRPQAKLKSFFQERLPKRLVVTLLAPEMGERVLQSISHSQFQNLARQFQNWLIKPNGSEGYRTAEITLGGVDCDALASKSMECRQTPGLFFIGEVLDVSGWLGGYNLQWAWSSGWCAGQYA